MKMKRVLFVISTLNTGGAQRIISNVIMSLPQEWEIDILLNDTENIVYPYRGRIISLACKPEADKSKLSYQAKVLLKRFRILRRLKKENHYQACISALTSANVINVLTGNRFCRTVLTVHCVASKEALGRIKEFILQKGIRLFYGKADVVVAVSEGIREDLLTGFFLNPEKVITVYNGYLIEDIRKKAKAALVPEEEAWLKGKGVKLVTVGRLTLQKGQWHLIRALQKVKKEIKEFRLYILGEGELEEYLKKLVMECGLKENVIFCGFCKNPYKIIARSDILVFPSVYEGFGNVLIEGMALGIPCISTDFDSGAREILAPETDTFYRTTAALELAKYGILCPVCNGVMYEHEPLTREEELLAESIIQMLSDKKLQEKYREAGKKRAEEFDMVSLIPKWMEVIEG